MFDVDQLKKPLSINDIDFRLQSINNGGYATILAYKDARVDMRRLDQAVGPLNWKREHTRENHNCIVSIWDESKGQWVSKEDTGAESYTEKEKGLASDSFKRACFNWGIGLELYDYPLIQVHLKDEEWQKGEGNKPNKSTWKLQLNTWRWFSAFSKGKISVLRAKDTNGVERFTWFSVEGLEKSINYIRENIASNNISLAAEAWYELEEGEQAALFIAPSKGGVFTTEERKVIQEEFRQYHPSNKE